MDLLALPFDSSWSPGRRTLYMAVGHAIGGLGVYGLIGQVSEVGDQDAPGTSQIICCLVVLGFAGLMGNFWKLGTETLPARLGPPPSDETIGLGIGSYELRPSWRHSLWFGDPHPRLV